MSILIKGMNLPEDGCHHMVCIYGNGVVVTNGGQWIAEELPPHGRCIDADEMLMRINHEVMEAYMDGVCYGVHPSQEYLYLLGEIIDDAPTIIQADPAEGGEL